MMMRLSRFTHCSRYMRRYKSTALEVDVDVPGSELIGLTGGGKSLFYVRTHKHIIITHSKHFDVLQKYST